ncbi:hypothetical protein U1Q18_026033 [Sarracenia purpurea var. burkii]
MAKISVKLDDKKVDDELSNINLRLLDLSDLDDFMVWATDDKVSKFCSWETFKSREDAVKYIIDFIIPHPWFRAICVGDRPIGIIFVRPDSGGDSCRGEIGYALASQYWGKGIATRAVEMTATAVFGEWPHLERLEGLVVANNEGSQRVLEKAGFQREGVLRKYLVLKGKTRDMVMFSLLSTKLISK